MALATVPLMPWAGKLMVKKASGGTYKTVKFVSESLRSVIERIDSNGLRGTRSQEEAMSVQGGISNGGSLSLVPNQLEIEQFLTHILGGTEVGNAWALAEAIVDDLYCEIWRGAGGLTFANGAVNKAVFKSQQNGPLTLDLDLLFRTATDLAAATAQSMLAGLPYVHSGLALSIGGTATRCKELTLTIDNQLKDDHRNNSQTVQEFPTQGRLITLDLVLPYSETNEALVANVMAASSGELTDYAVNAVYTNPDSKTMTFAMPRMQWKTYEENVGGTDQTDLKLSGQALASATRNDELTVTMSA